VSPIIGGRAHDVKTVCPDGSEGFSSATSLFLLKSGKMRGMKRSLQCGGKPMTVIVLAGGRGRRMKADKAGLAVLGGTLLGRVLGQVAPYFDEILISVSPGRKIDLGRRHIGTSGARKRARAEGKRRLLSRTGWELRTRFRVVEDGTSGQGPVAGILAGLKAAANDACLVLACDIPDVPFPFLRKLAEAAGNAEIAVPVNGRGKHEPLLAVYSRAVIPRIEELLRAGERSLVPLFGLCRTALVPIGKPDWLRNLNTRRDYEKYLEALSRRSEDRKGRTRPLK
jgi:molybdopterin-guanine dinucleotide biosynthesis protein A